MFRDGDSAIPCGKQINTCDFFQMVNPAGTGANAAVYTRVNGEG